MVDIDFPRRATAAEALADARARREGGQNAAAAEWQEEDGDGVATATGNIEAAPDWGEGAAEETPNDQ